jgi:NADPH2:quinone reductase
VNKQMMRAAVITSYGGPEVLEVREVPMCPEPTVDRVRVRVWASALNRADVLQRMGHYPAPPGFSQDIPGMEFAGEVEQIGPEVRNWQIGQRVFGITGGAAQAEFVVVPEGALAEIPSNLDWIGAAAVPEAFITSHDALFTRGDLQIGENVLISAIGSGVGLAAAQLARAAGATVYGTSRTASKVEQAKEFGMHIGIAVGDNPNIIVERISQLTKGRGIQLVMDLVGAAYLAAYLQALSQKGRMIFVGTTSGSRATLEIGAVMSKRLTIIGTVLRARSVEEKAIATRLFAQHVVPLLANGNVRPTIDKVFEFNEIRSAHERMESNESFGKIVIRIRSL